MRRVGVCGFTFSSFVLDFLTWIIIDDRGVRYFPSSSLLRVCCAHAPVWEAVECVRKMGVSDSLECQRTPASRHDSR